VVFCIVFVSFEMKFFFAKTHDGFGGVQRRGHVKGAVCPRSSKTLDREQRWSHAVFQGSGLSEEKMEREKTSAENTDGAVQQTAAGLRIRKSAERCLRVVQKNSQTD
jgi:hypothetical protein